MKLPTPKRLPSGNWFIQLRLGGESVPVTEPTERRCVQSARLIKAEYLAGKRIAQTGSDKTLREACTEYIERRASRLSPTSVHQYEKLTTNNFQSIMDIQIDNIDWDTVDRAISEECKRKGRNGKPLAPKTIKNAFLFIISVLRVNGVVFAAPFTLPEVKRIPPQIHPAEVVYGAIAGSDIELECLLAMWLTMSISEIRGLTKSKSINGDKLTIVETVVDVDGVQVRKAGGKEEERTRTQIMPQHIKNLINKREGDIICQRSGRAVYKRLQRLLKDKGIPPISFHKLRHISASTMAALNIPSNYAQEKGGWKTDYTMQTVYTHTFTNERLQADAKMDAFFTKIIDNANENANAISNAPLSGD